MQTVNRVAINSIVQYIQLILNVLIGLVSVRLILDALGASDYGIYDLIAGVVSLLSFISTSLSQTSMRFLSVSLGKNDEVGTRRTFSVCFWLHILIGLLLVLVLVIVGFFIFNGFLNIPEARINTAKVLYYIMIVNLFLNISVTPFNAIISAHERFVYISIVQIFDSLLKLAIALVLVGFAKDKLLLYGFLMFGITVINVLCYVVFAVVKYRRMLSVQRKRMSEMAEVTGFAGWTVLDVLGSVATRQGYAILLNSFFGTVVNAVFALARQIEGHLYTISASVINTMKPQIMKSQGAGDSNRMFRLSLTAGKLGFSMMSLVSIPLLVMMPDVLALWLKDVPEGTVLFSRLMVSACMFEQLTRGLVYANQAIGNIKWFSIIVSTIRVLALPISWVFFHFGAPAYVAIVVFLICETVGSFSRVFILAKISDFKASSFLTSVIVKIVPSFIVALVLTYLSTLAVSGIWGILLACVVSVLSYSATLWLTGLTKEEKYSLKIVIGSALSKVGIKANLA